MREYQTTRSDLTSGFGEQPPCLARRNEPGAARASNRREKRFQAVKQVSPYETRPNFNMMGKMRGPISRISEDSTPIRERGPTAAPGEIDETKRRTSRETNPGRPVDARVRWRTLSSGFTDAVLNHRWT